MTIEIDDDETIQMIRSLCELTGEDDEQAILVPVGKRLNGCGPQKKL
jgi:hypothetical protein